MKGLILFKILLPLWFANTVAATPNLTDISVTYAQSLRSSTETTTPRARVKKTLKNLANTIVQTDESQYCYLKATVDKVFKNSECNNSNYLNFYSKPPVGQSPLQDKIKLGSFNLKHLGNSPFKYVEGIAQIINQWDIVSVLELDSVSKNSGFYKYNLQLKLLSRDLFNEKKFGKSKQLIQNMFRPGYLQLLDSLNNQFPNANWSLMLAKVPVGPKGHEEFVGYFYKAHLAKAMRTKACPNKAKGCLIQFSDELAPIKASVARPAFITRFLTQKNDLTLFTSHFRFNPPNEELTKKAIKYINQRESGLFDKLDISKRIIHRYIELYMHLEQVYLFKQQNKFSSSKYIFMGDLNIGTHQSNYKEAWELVFEHTLKNAEVFVDNKTTISVKGRFSNPYDHFIYNPKRLSRCSKTLPSRFNFIDDNSPFTDATHLLAINLRSLKDNTTKQIIKKFITHKYWSNLRLFYDYSLKDLITKYNPTDRFIMELVEKFHKRLVASQFNMNTPYTFYIQTISDHLPISMTCDN